ncbi:cytochrome protein [Setomelanomma holmii]|uniref:Cytochrome protein n=1 Tax=Setomelanomma holmii TaxID=210430 RepID=A0A9P4LQU2_9PLEO|nr:cytochrome protein [Setomelanomma holmii]
MHLQAAILLAVVSGSCYVLYSLIWESFISLARSVPGPKGGRLSRLWFYRKVRNGSFHHENIALHEQYGPVVRVAPGFFSISTPEKAIYGIGSNFPKSDWYQGWKHPSPDRWTLFPDQDIKRHAETRKRFQGLYSMSSLLSYESYVDDCIDIFLGKLDQFAKSGQSMDLVHWFQCYAADVIAEITYSERFGFLDNGEDVAGTMAALDKSMSYSTLVGIYPKLHPYLYAVLEKIPGSGAAGRTYLMSFVQRKIAERNVAREKGNYEPKAKELEDGLAPKDFLDKLTDAKEQDPDKVTPYHIFMMGLSNIIAGADTTAVSLSGILYYLITSPKSLAKLRREIEEHGRIDKRVTFADSQEMPYLQAVIKEALRMHSATGLPLWRVVPQGGVQIGEYWLPPGSNVGVNSWVAHYDKSIFGEDAHVFRPERWLEAKNASADKLKVMEASYMPFGLGSRTCLGRHISTLEMNKLVPEIVKKFDLALGMPKEDWKTINYWFVKPERLPVTIRPRVIQDHT